MADHREHFGSGKLETPRALSVFINCPYDAEFLPLFDALIFATVCCGFMPRSAMESGDASTPRLTRIAVAMQGSKYSVHDLSRCHGEGDDNLARFNMPLELGMAVSERLRTDDAAEAHDWLCLVPDGHAHTKVLSDLAGYDPEAHDGSKDAIVASMMSWLATRPDAIRTPKPSEVLVALPEFEIRLQQLRSDWGGKPPWSDILLAAMRVAQEAGLIPVVLKVDDATHALS